MAMRDVLNQHKVAVSAGAAVVVIGAVALTAYSLMGDGGPRQRTQEYFTVDDGRTLFADSVDRLPPFDHHGKPAVRARVFTTDGGRTQFVAYLERYTPTAIKLLTDANAARAAGRPAKIDRNSAEIMLRGTEVKKPGEANWIDPKDMRNRARVTNVPTPANGTLEAVYP